MPANANEPPAADVAEIAARVEAQERYDEAVMQLSMIRSRPVESIHDLHDYRKAQNELGDAAEALVPLLLAEREAAANWRTRALAAEAALKPFAAIWDDWLGADDLDHSGAELYNEFSLFMRQWLIDGDEGYVEAHKLAYELLAGNAPPAPAASSDDGA